MAIVTNAVCTFCGCVCDDIELHADGERIVEDQARLHAGQGVVHEPHRRAALPRRAHRRPARPPLDEAVEAAAEFLDDAHMPLIYGLSNITCETQREAVPLGGARSAAVDRQPHVPLTRPHGDGRPVGR